MCRLLGGGSVHGRSGDLGGMKVGAAVARLDGSGDVVPQILPGGQAYVDDGVVGQISGQDDGVDDRVTQCEMGQG